MNEEYPELEGTMNLCNDMINKQKMEDYSNVTITISELVLDGNTAIKIVECIKKLEPEIWLQLSKCLKSSISNDLLNKLKTNEQ